MVVFLLGLVIVVGSLAAAVWRVRWLRGTLRTQAEVLGIRSHEEEGGGQYNMMETVYVSQFKFAGTDGATVYFEQKQGSKPRFRGSPDDAGTGNAARNAPGIRRPPATRGAVSPGRRLRTA